MTGWDGMGYGGTGWDGTGWDGTGRDEMKSNYYLDFIFCAAPDKTPASLPPNCREGGGATEGREEAGWKGEVGEEVGSWAVEEEMAAATRSKSTPGGVEPAPTCTVGVRADYFG